MKLYHWPLILSGSASDGMAFAIAGSADEARALLIALSSAPRRLAQDLAEAPEVHDLTEPFGDVCWGGD